MKVIPEKDQYWRQCYFCGTYRNPNNPVAFELETIAGQDYNIEVCDDEYYQRVCNA